MDDETLMKFVRLVVEEPDRTVLLTTTDLSDGTLSVVRQPGFCDPEHLILRVSDELGEAEVYLSPEDVQALIATLREWAAPR
jgi:hypothetical protein